MVRLIMKNETLLTDNKLIMKQLKDWEVDKEIMERMKQKNTALKIEINACQNRERLVVWVMLLLQLVKLLVVGQRCRRCEAGESIILLR